METLIQATGLNKHYGATRALADVNLSIRQGCIVGLIGPNGAGKTTLLKAILGLTGFQGELSVMGLDPRTHRAELMKQVCFIADVAVLPRWLRVREALDFVEGVHPNFCREKAEMFLSRTKIQHKSRVKALSKGMVAQLHLALIMAIDARLLVLDEPTLGLDILYRKAFYDSLLNDYFTEDRTIVVTTHQVEEIENILTDLVFIREGELVLDATMDEIGERFVELEPRSDALEQAEALVPIARRRTLGKHRFLFDGVAVDQLAELGATARPTVADLFVAYMGQGELQ